MVLIYAFVAGVAGITADKFASEFGVLDGEPKVLINGKKANRGTSGAVTWFGTIMGGIAASADTTRNSTSTEMKNHHSESPK